jgi:hypothetical protein
MLSKQKLSKNTAEKNLSAHQNFILQNMEMSKIMVLIHKVHKVFK